MLHKLVSLTGESKEDILNDIHSHLNSVSSEIRSGRYPVEAFIIHKNLTKNPEEYADAKSQPHVLVALQAKSKGILFRSGDTVPYVICVGKDTKSVAQRAYHPDFLGNVEVDHNLKIDFEWYLQQQVLPPIVRLCRYIEGTDSSRLANALGLSRYIGKEDEFSSMGNSSCSSFSSLLSFDDNKGLDPLILTCPYCSCSFSVLSTVAANNNEKKEKKELLVCQECSKLLPEMNIRIQILIAIKKLISLFYSGYLSCDDPGCGARCRTCSVYEKRCPSSGCRGQMIPEISDRKLYLQLLYWKSLVTESGFIFPSHVERMIEMVISRNEYPIIRLGTLFQRISSGSF